MAYRCHWHKDFVEGCPACMAMWDRYEVKRIPLPENENKFSETVKVLESKIIESMMLPESMINHPNIPINIPPPGRYSLFSDPPTYEPFPEDTDGWTD